MADNLEKVDSDLATMGECPPRVRSISVSARIMTPKVEVEKNYVVVYCYGTETECHRFENDAQLRNFLEGELETYRYQPDLTGEDWINQLNTLSIEQLIRLTVIEGRTQVKANRSGLWSVASGVDVKLYGDDRE